MYSEKLKAQSTQSITSQLCLVSESQMVLRHTYQHHVPLVKATCYGDILYHAEFPKKFSTE